MADPSKLLPCVIILVEDIDVVGSFLRQTFECPAPTVYQHPCKHAIQSISRDSSILMIQSNDCDEALLASLSTATVRHVFAVVQDASRTQRKATQSGSQVIESNIDQNGGSSCILEGPEGIIFHIISDEKWKSHPCHEIIMSSMHPKEEKADSETSEGYSEPEVKPVFPRPIIPTLDVGLLSNTHPSSFVPCPPNSRKPIPFETDVRLPSLYYSIPNISIFSSLKGPRFLWFELIL